MNTFQYPNCNERPHYANCNCHQCLLFNVPTSIRSKSEQVDPRNFGHCNRPKNVDVHVQNASTKKLLNKTAVDTSNFTIEERLIAAVWVHERKRTRFSISKLRNIFRQRFGRDPPAKNTLLGWERKLFSTGNVCDAPRSGRPSDRRNHMDKVTVSVHTAPKLSTRARALSLRVPRTTLCTIPCEDLNNKSIKDNDVGSCTPVGKNPAKMRKDVVKSSQLNKEQSSLQSPLSTPHTHSNS